jgi:hypothetical protein
VDRPTFHSAATSSGRSPASISFRALSIYEDTGPGGNIPSMPFKEGQEVLIKNPRSLVGVIVRARPGDRDELPENRRYLVRIQESERFYLPHDLEALEEPAAKLNQYSPEWNVELTPENDSNEILTQVIGLTCSGQTGRNPPC